MTTLGDRVRDERLRVGMSQTALAGEDFSPSYISLIEAGRRMPTESALAVLADRLGTSTDYLRHGDQAPSEERARLEIGYARLALSTGDPGQAKDRLLALELASVSPRFREEALRTLAAAHDALGELLEAVAVLEPLLEEARRQKRWLDVAGITTDLVAVYHEGGDLGRSIELGEANLAQVEAAGLAATDEHLRLASTLLWSYYERGDLLFATHRAAELIRLADAEGSDRGRGSIYWNAALVAQGRGDLAEARRLTQRALAYLSEGTSSRDVPRLRLHYAWLMLRSDPPEPNEALSELRLAAKQLAVVGTEAEQARCAIEIGRAHLILGDADRAEEQARSALGWLDEQAVLDQCHGQLLLGDAHLMRGRLDEARDAYNWAADRLAMVSASREAAAVWRSLGDRKLEYGDRDGALRAYENALTEVGLRPSSFPVVVPGRDWVGRTEV